MKASGLHRLIVFLLAGLLIVSLDTSRGLAEHSDPLVPSVSASAAPTSIVATGLSTKLLDEIGVKSLHNQKGLLGKGVVVGVVDTGVDPAALLAQRLTDIVDITNEGLVYTSAPMSPDKDGIITYQGRSYSVKALVSKSGTFHVGMWTKDNVQRAAADKAPLSGLPAIPIVLADTYIANQYATVYLDTDRDGDFTDEVPLEKYANSRSYASIRLGSGSLSVGVSDIADGGKSVTLFFDANGHGTAMASVLVGIRDGLSPVAPSASIVAIKAVTSAGESNWNLIARGIQAACDRGAHVVIVSASPQTAQDHSTASAALDGVMRGNKNVLIVMAAGNEGPGVGTLSAIGRWDNLLVIGGYIPATISQALGWSSKPVFYTYSSVGPDSEGYVPGVLSVALSPIALPEWAAGGSSTGTIEGTSVSAAYAGGIAALVAEGVGTSGSNLGPRLKAAMEQTAAPLAGLTAAEQGHGVIQPEKALGLAKTIGGASKARAVLNWNGKFYANALFDRCKVPGLLPVTLDNLAPASVNINMSLPSWASLPYPSFSIAPVDQRAIKVNMNLTSPGLYSEFFTGDDPELPGREIDFAVSAIVPSHLEPGYSRWTSLLAAGEMHREFLRVEAGSESFEVRLAINAWTQGSFGKARMLVYDRLGTCVHRGSWIGRGLSQKEDSAAFAYPEEGIWEVVIISDPSLAGGSGSDETYCNLEFGLGNTVTTSGRSVYGTTKGSYYDIPVSLTNHGDSFDAVTRMVVDGSNGFLKRGRVQATPGLSSMISLPHVDQGTEFLFFSVTGPTEPSASISFYLYGLDAKTGQWKEIDAAEATSSAPGRITLTNPPAGQYVAYVDTIGPSGLASSFSWMAAATGKTNITGVQPLGDSKKLWANGAVLTVRARIPSNVPNGQAALFVWDAKSGDLRTVVPVSASSTGAEMLVTLVEGALNQGTLHATVRAWSRESMVPIDACVEVDGIWYQLSDGYAVVKIERENLNGLSVRAEYPGMDPWVNMPSN